MFSKTQFPGFKNLVPKQKYNNTRAIELSYCIIY